MIEYISGDIASLNPTEVVIDTRMGIAYLLNITLSTFTRLEKEKSARLLVHEVIREDAHVLFGFIDERERGMFRLLIGVSGIGANTARIILSAFSVGELEQLIVAGDHGRLKSVKGIGLKTAQRIIVDLKDRIKAVEGGVATVTPSAPSSDVYEEAVAALVILGFGKAQSQKAVRKLLDADPTLQVETAVKRAISML